MGHRTPTFAALVLVLAALVLAAAPRPCAAQAARVSVEQENFRQEPMGKRLATVNGGTRLQVQGSQGRWRQVVLSGWIWTPSVSPTDRAGFDLVVTADGGENLRQGPSPDERVAARLLEGFLLERVEERGDWTRVRRAGWMWAPSLSVEEDGSSGAGGEGGDRAPPESGGAEAPDRLVVEGGAARLFISPRGDTLAAVRPGADLTVLRRQGDWARVRLEGWVRVSELVAADSAGALTEVTVEELTSNPDQFQGRRVQWTVQFISLERAEPVRTDFYEGEPFILARPSPSSQGFVYLAVPPEMVPQVEELQPLETIRVLGRVRTGRSALMGAPVLELLSFEHVGGPAEATAGGGRR